MPDHVCSVCGQPAENKIKTRWFCKKHFTSATYQRPHAWRGYVLLIVAQVVFVGLVYLLDLAIKPVLTGSSLVWAGILMSLVPAVLWMVFFYRQDRLEPEPKSFILAVFLLGGLLAAAIGTPLLENIFHVSKWIHAGTAATILGSILVVGFTQEFLKYAAVRYSIYRSVEFDEATDGVIYATAAGLGYATLLNIQFVVSNGGVDLGASVIRMAVVALAHASFAAIGGYFLGRAKFEQKPVWWMPLGLTLAATLNGLFNWLRGRLVQSGISLEAASTNPWLGLILAATLAILTAGIILWLVRRDIRGALATEIQADTTTEPSSSPDQPSFGERWWDWGVVGILLIALLSGWFYKSSVENRSVQLNSAAIQAETPQGWLNLDPEGSEVLHVSDPLSSGFGTTYIVQNIPVEAGSAVGQAASLLTLQRGQQLTAYRVLDQQPVTVYGQAAYELSYVFVVSDPNLTHDKFPNIVRGLDYIYMAGDHVVVVTYWAEKENFEYDLGRFQRFLKSLKF